MVKYRDLEIKGCRDLGCIQSPLSHREKARVRAKPE
jgi:hypothetical protein